MAIDVNGLIRQYGREGAINYLKLRLAQRQGRDVQHPSQLKFRGTRAIPTERITEFTGPLRGDIGAEDPGHLRFIGGSLKRSLVVPAVGIGETISSRLVRPGRTAELKQEFRDLQQQYLDAGPHAGRFAASFATRVITDAIPWVVGGPASLVSKTGGGVALRTAAKFTSNTGKLRKAFRFGRGATPPAIEGLLIGTGESADAPTAAERLVAIGLITTLGASAGGILRAGRGRIKTDPFDPETPAWVNWAREELTADGLRPHQIAEGLRNGVGTANAELRKVSLRAAEYQHVEDEVFLRFVKTKASWLPDDPKEARMAFNHAVYEQLRKPVGERDFSFLGGLEHSKFEAPLLTRIVEKVRGERALVRQVRRNLPEAAEEFNIHVNEMAERLLAEGVVPRESDLGQIIELGKATGYQARTFNAFANDPNIDWPKDLLSARVWDPNAGGGGVGRSRSVHDIGYEYFADAFRRDGMDPAAHQEEILRFMHDLAVRDPNVLQMSGGKAPKPFSDLFKHRGDLPDPVLGILGLRSPVQRYFDTITRQTLALEQFKMARLIRETGEGTIFFRNLTDTPEFKATGELPPGYRKVSNLETKDYLRTERVEATATKQDVAKIKKGMRVAQFEGQRPGTKMVAEDRLVAYDAKTREATVVGRGGEEKIPIHWLTDSKGRDLLPADEFDLATKGGVTSKEIVQKGDKGPYYVKDDIHRVLFEAQEAQKVGLLLMSNAFAKQAKTLLSIQTQARNFIANPMLVAAMGHSPWRFFDFTSQKSPWKLVKSRFGFRSDDAAEAWITEATKRRLLYEGVRGNDFQFYTEELQRYIGGLGDSAKIRKAFLGAMTGSKVQKWAEKGYHVGDEFWKYTTWMDEVSDLLWQRGEKSFFGRLPELKDIPTEVLDEAAEIVRNSMPTYSLVPKVIQRLKRNPFVGTFVSFPSEIFKNFKNTMQLGVRQLRADNPRTRAIGAKRLGGMLAALNAPGAFGSFMRAQTKTTEKEEAAISVLGQPWDKTAQKVVMGVDTEKGRVTYFNSSFLDPLSYLKRGFLAAIGNELEDEEGWRALRDEFVGTFLGPELAATAFLEVAFNKRGIPLLTGDDSGQLWVPHSDATTKLRVGAKRVGRALAPGTLLTLERIARGAAGTGLGMDLGLNEILKPTSDWGKSYEFGHEITALAGPRIVDLDVSESLKFRANNYRGTKQSAGRIYNRASGRPGATISHLEQARAEANGIYERAYQEMLEAVEAARALGRTDQDIFKVLREQKVSVKDARRLVYGGKDAYKPIVNRIRLRPAG